MAGSSPAMTRRGWRAQLYREPPSGAAKQPPKNKTPEGCPPVFSFRPFNGGVVLGEDPRASKHDEDRADESDRRANR